MYPDHNWTWLHVVYIIGGVYNPNKLKTPLKKWLCTLYNTFLIVWCLIYFFPSEISYIDRTIDDLYAFLNSIGLFTTHLLGVIKWLVMIRFEKEFNSIQKQLVSEEYHYEDYNDFKPGLVQFKCRKYSRIMVVTFVIFGHFVGITKDIKFIYDFSAKGDQVGIGNVTCLGILPFDNYIPFNTESYWKCILGFILQAYPVTIFVGPIISCKNNEISVNSDNLKNCCFEIFNLVQAFDLTFAVIIIYACGNFINIRDAFKTMRERCLVRLGLPEDYKVLNDIENPELEREIAVEVRKLSIHLQQHILIVERMEFICRYVVLGQAMTALVALVTSLYITSVETSFSPMLVAQIQYGMSINVELANYCIVGDAITEWSSDVATGIASSDWLSCSKTVKMSLMINLMRLQKPIYFTMGKFSPLTLNTFLQILKGSYSYFTFLQKT